MPLDNGHIGEVEANEENEHLFSYGIFKLFPADNFNEAL